MNSYLSMMLAAERHRDLLAAADRHRLAAAALSPTALRRRVGRRLVGIGSRLAGQPYLVQPTTDC
jgi:hypothetical protein